MQMGARAVSRLVINGFIPPTRTNKLTRRDNIACLHIKFCHVGIPDLVITILDNE